MPIVAAFDGSDPFFTVNLALAGAFIFNIRLSVRDLLPDCKRLETQPATDKKKLRISREFLRLKHFADRDSRASAREKSRPNLRDDLGTSAKGSQAAKAPGASRSDLLNRLSSEITSLRVEIRRQIET